eukprot:4525297-Prymnesium_polylepis.2
MTHYRAFRLPLAFEPLEGPPFGLPTISTRAASPLGMPFSDRSSFSAASPLMLATVASTRSSSARLTDAASARALRRSSSACRAWSAASSCARACACACARIAASASPCL